MRYDRRRHSARHTDEFVFYQLVPYLGNKRHLLDLIGAALRASGIEPRRARFLDAFAGSGVVSRFAKRLGFAVTANDWEPYARSLNTPAISCHAPPPFAALGGQERAVAELDALPGKDGWVSRNLCPRDDQAPDPTRERLFYRRTTGRRIDAIRDRIAEWRLEGAIDEVEQHCLLAPLLYQASWLANTSGVFKGFHHGWGGRNGTALYRILADLRLDPPRYHDNGRTCRVLAFDALGPEIAGESADVAYLDPPYNQHPYASNYHVLNSLALWDKPDVPPPTLRGNKAAIRADWKARRSPFNHRAEAAAAYRRLLANLDSDLVLTSYSTDGMIPPAELVAAAAEGGALSLHARPYKRYRVSPTRPSSRPRTLEFVLVCDRRKRPRPSDIDRILRDLGAVPGTKSRLQ